MLLQQFYLPSLGHASYLVGDETTGQALVFDPRRDVHVYTDTARAQGLRIAYAADSHGHNDYLSGLTELAAATGAEAWASAAGEFGYPHRGLHDGEVLEIGDVGIQVIHTPGHTPEHISLLIYDRAASADHPVLLLSGGALLVGDLARPDLLGGAEAAREAARVFCDTIQTKLLPLPDGLQVFPTHVAGSLCGANISSRLSTTLGYERRTNPLLAEVEAKDQFVTECLGLGNLPAIPPYWARMRARNLAGIEPLGNVGEPPALSAPEFEQHQNAGNLVLDTRAPEAFGGGHIPGALNVGLGPLFATWAGTILPADARVLLVLDEPADLTEATWQLLRIGYPTPAGWLRGGMRTWRSTHRPLATTPQLDVDELKTRLDRDDMRLLDVRHPHEWATGHIPGATHITGADLPRRLAEVPTDKPLAVTCGSGYRSSAAASLLAHHGHTQQVANVLGGMSAWKQADFPVLRQ